MPELQVRVPYDAWGSGEEWEDGHVAVMDDLFTALEESGLGEDDDPDHQDDHIAFFLSGDDMPSLAQLASDVLARHGVLARARAVIVDLGSAPDGSDQTETVVELPAPREA
jgi:hypothetical protein